MTSHRWTIAAGAVIASTLVAAQSPTPARFDVASIKRNRSVDRVIGGVFSRDTYQRTNATLLVILTEAYRNRFLPWEIVGGPGWLGTDKFDIVAKANGSPWTMEMVRSLLADRFKLKAHEQSRESDVYRLVVDRTDRRLGPKLTPARLPVDERSCTTRIRSGSFSAKCVTLGGMFYGTLQFAAQRRVIDETGLTEKFDIDLTWDPALESSPDARVPSDAPSIFTAVREQLGLRLESGKAQVPLLVIDSIEPPTED